MPKAKKAAKTAAKAPARRSTGSQLMTSNPNSYVVQFGVVFIVVAAIALAYYAGVMQMGK